MEKSLLKQIYLARHPDKGKDVHGVFTEKGAAQIDEFKGIISNAALTSKEPCKINIYFSNRDRSKIMAHLLSEKIKETVSGSEMPIEITTEEDTRINQLRYNKKFITMDREYYPKGQQEKVFEPWIKIKDYFPGTETPDECFNRVNSFYMEKSDEIEADTENSRIVVAISHSYLLDAFFYRITEKIRVIKPGEYALLENNSMKYAGEIYENVSEKISRKE